MHMKSCEPKISVIVPVYNVEKYLRKCLDSICGQTYRNLEILCVNDGSTDGSAAILEEYAARDSRIQIFTQENAGLSAARNTALAHACGEWVTGVDSDDYLDTDTVEKAVACISEEVDVISYGIHLEWEGMEAHAASEAFYAPKGKKGVFPLSADLLLNMQWEFCGKLWRRSFIVAQKASFPHGLLYEDWFFFFAYVPVAKGVYLMDTQKYHYLRRCDSIIGQSQKKNPRCMDHLKELELLMQARQTQKIPYDITPVSIYNLVQAYDFVKCNAPEELQEAALCESRRIAEQYGVLEMSPDYLRFLRPQPWWKKIFVRHRHGKSSYGFGPLRFLVVTYKNGVKTLKFLGIKLYKKKY